VHARHLQPLSGIVTAGLLSSVLGTALGAEIPNRAGRGLTLGPCVAKASAPCWKDAPVLRRFAPEVRVFADPMMTEVRLAHDGEHLLVHAPRLPRDVQLELVVGPSDGAGLADTQVLRAGRGVHALALSPKLQTGQQRALRIHLRRAADPVTRTWAPRGHGDLTRPALALFSPSSTASSAAVTVATDGDRLHAHAAGAAHLRIVHRRPMLPRGGKGIPGPWSAVGSDAIDTPHPPFSGTYDLQATWLDEAGHITDQIVREFVWRAPGAPFAENHGFHPAPKSIEPLDDAPFALSADARACSDVLDWLPAVKLVEGELARLTGIRPSGDCASREPGRADIWWHMDRAVPSEGFRVEVSGSAGAHIYASDRRGAVYAGLALSDALGTDGTVPALRVTDAPAVGWRILFHKATVAAKGRIDPSAMIDFIERAVTRGRYNMLVLHLDGGYRYPSHPELAKPNAWTPDDLEQVVAAARRLGIRVVPGMSSPGHANWLTAAFPQLKEDANGALLCTRHPETRPLLADLMTDLLDAFGHPGFLHIGHDEVWWRTRRAHEIQRCPRCEGTPRWLLLADSIQWHHDWLGERDTRPILWSDMLVKGWHGGNGEVYRASNRLPEAQRADYLTISWTRVGDSVRELGSKGYAVVRGHTGYTDWKRQGLTPRVDEVAGEALAVFYATPWSSFGGQTGPVVLLHHWPNVILAGATGWRPDLADTPIAETLDHLTGSSAYTPGYVHRVGKADPLLLDGTRADVDAHLPTSAEVGGVLFELSQPMAAMAGTEIEIAAVGKVRSLSLLQATETSREGAQSLLQAHKQASTLDGPAVATMHVRWADGEETTVPIRLGMDTDRPDRPVRGHFLWRAAGTLRVPSLHTAELLPTATDRAFFRWDWANPRPEQSIERVVWTVDAPGVRWLLLGATALR
jgi:hypothetical protein